MRTLYLIFLLAVLPALIFGQPRPFEIFGTLRGNYSGKIYLFFDGNYRQRDSISSEIKNGAFYFKGKVSVPVQARLHLDQKSFIGDFYIDNGKTYVNCTTERKVYNNGQDTLNMLSVIRVKGSHIDKLRTDFEIRLDDLRNSKLPDDEKRNAYYQNLSAFIKKYPKNKLSPYLLGKASSLFYSQAKELSSLIDTSLNNSFEVKTVKALLNQLAKSKNSAIGTPFRNFIFQDGSGHKIDTKQFIGKYTLIVCWASWCKPCRAEHPELNLIYDTYKDRDFEMLGVSLDKDKEKWVDAIAKDQLHWEQVIDPNAFDGEMAKHYAIEAIPANFLLDKEGKIIGAGLSVKEIREQLGNLL